MAHPALDLGRRWIGFATSASLHLAVAWLLLSATGGGPAATQVQAHDHQPRVLRIVPVHAKKVGNNLAPRFPNPGDGHPKETRGIDQELKGLQVAILDDPSFEMLRVLRRHPEGLIAFRSKGQAGAACPVFRASDYRSIRSICVSPDDYFAVELMDSRGWPEIARLMADNGLSPSQYDALALFPREFKKTVHALLIRAEAARGIGKGRVKLATLRFAADTPAGVIVESLTL